MKNTKKRKISSEKVKKIERIICIVIGIIIALFVLYKANDFIIFGKNKEINLVINNNNITANLKNKIIIEDKEIYISKQDLGNFFDKYIYTDEANNQIITTYGTKAAAIKLDANEIIINGSKKQTYNHPKKVDDTIYIPISELKDVYGIEIEYIENTKIVTLDSIAREQKKAIIAKNVPLKSSKKIIAKTVERAKKGSYAIIVSEEKEYTKIRTESGKIGYVKTKKLANKITIRENLEEEKQIEGKINLVWDYFSEYGSAPSRINENLKGVNVVSPAFFHLDKNGNLNANIGNAGKEYIKWAHSKGFKVWPMVQNAGEGMLTTTSMVMNDYNKRQELIKKIADYCVEYGLDGINIDFENMKKEDKDMFSRFIIELTPVIKEMGRVVSVDVTAPDGGETWSLCFDRHVIGDVADYIVFMAYDEYGASSNKAGTTAGYNWITIGLEKFLVTEEIDSDKIILAIPLYARIWTENSEGEIIKQSTVPIKNMKNIIPNNINKEWKDELKQNYIEYKEGNNTKKMWVEDEESLKAKIELISKDNLAGVASWAKDMEPEGFWDFLNKELNK